jgi:hypothetical protein
VFPVPHEILQATNSSDVAAKATEKLKIKSKQIIKGKTTKKTK